MDMIYRQFNKQQLETEYSPSSCVDDIAPFIGQYIKQSEAAEQLAVAKQRVLKDIAYGDNRDQVLDLFLPMDEESNQGCLHVYIHGGYWQELSKQESSFAATNFQRHGCHFAVINYSLAPSATLTEIVEQNRRALAYLYLHAEHYGYRRDKIYVSGSSAGAHLAMLMAQTHWDGYLSVEADASIIAGICAVSGIYDIEPIVHTYVNEPLQLTVTEIEKLSPLALPSKVQCPVIIAYGDNETSEFKRQSNHMATLLNVVPECIKGRNHFDVILDLADSSSTLFELVARQMRL
ncbi:alpha/beta hydrolase [Thalassotalea maritima]|uniref:alpha/beta hydrolase n=1 Tax=Thalassotalea maritima TaxID=3242416 RepID=UPI0035283D94